MHHRRATTVILEEDGSVDDKSKTVNIILPPRKTASQVEEVGSYKLESHEQSISYQIMEDGDGKKIRPGIVDELDSDTDRSTTRTRTTSRNISINSVQSDDEINTGGSKSRDITVSETKKNIPFEDGYAEMKITKIVMEEQEILTEELPEGEENISEYKSKKSERDVQKEIEDKAKRLYAELSAEDEKTPRTRKISGETGKGSLYDIEESNEGRQDLSPEEARQQRIKEIRANARRASLLSRGESTEQPDETKTQQPGESPNEEHFSSKSEYYEKYEKTEQIDDGVKTTELRETSIDSNEVPQNGKQEKDENDDGVPRNSYLDNLLKHAQRQRSVLDEIIDEKDRSLSRSRETSRQRSIVDEERRKSYQRLDSRETRPNFVMDLEDTKVNEGEPVKLEVKLTGEPQPKLTWLHDNEEVRPDGHHIHIEQKPDGSASLSIDRTEPTDSGEYRGE